MRTEFVVVSIAVVLFFGLLTYFWPPAIWFFIPIGLLIFMGIYDMIQDKHAIRKNFPLLGRLRYVADDMRPKVHQYFVESELDGTPVNRMFRSVVYQRAKNELDTNPFGTKMNVYAEGYEWMNHSISAKDHHDLDPDPRIMIGEKHSAQPYSCSLLNISAMSFGSISKNAVMALNGGAKQAGFAHNTGEGGISPYHLKYGGDLIYQVGTGYFGCRSDAGSFDPDKFKDVAAPESVKMIELKLSQGAKPGHGGILPAKKITKEISEIRSVPMGKDVLSPPYHKAFDTPSGMLELIQQMRELSGGKPVGFKLCVGNKSEFVSICKAIIETGIVPDFIAVDGGEGGTGAAPLEFSNSVGMPLREGLAFVHNTLVGFDLRDEIKILASGKIFTAFHMFRTLALGADACYSARGMMLSLGCIQALECNKNTCPTGITTHDPERMKGLDVEAKIPRVAHYHKDTIEAFVELLAASGLSAPDQINRSHVNRRIVNNLVQRYDEIYPYVKKGCLINGDIPLEYKTLIERATAQSF